MIFSSAPLFHLSRLPTYWLKIQQRSYQHPAVVVNTLGISCNTWSCSIYSKLQTLMTHHQQMPARTLYRAVK